MGGGGEETCSHALCTCIGNPFLNVRAQLAGTSLASVAKDMQIFKKVNLTLMKKYYNVYKHTFN